MDTEALNRPGRRVLDDRYELVELIGSGGMADVWCAHDRRLDRDVAVKILSSSAVRDASRRRRVEREARALAATNHPNIVSVYDYGEAEGEGGVVLPYIVMELVDGPDLHRYLAENGPIGIDEAQEMMLGVLAAIERAHAAGIVHGDLKPANVFVGSHGPKVGDFGVARILDEETGTTTVAATPTFAAPEVLKGERPSRASDIYSAGCLAFELLTGRPPFEGSNGWEVAQKHMESPPPRVREFRPDVAPELEATILRAMDKDPNRRFDDVASLAVAMAAKEPAAPTATVPLAAAPQPTSPDATQTLDKRPDLARVAVLGPLAPWADRVGERARAAGTTLARSRRALLLVLVGALVLLGIPLLMADSDDADPVVVPDVYGKKVSEAQASLRLKGFDVAGVSYQPSNGEPNRVLKTIPERRMTVEPRSDIHIIASARAATPQPVVRSNDGGGGGGDRVRLRQRRGGGGKGKGKGDD